MNYSIILIAIFCLLAGCSSQPKYQMVPIPMLTPFTEQVNPENPLPEYPRPQMVRSEWMNLNGLWNYNLMPIDFKPIQGFTKRESWTNRDIPNQWKGKILVPFSIDAPLSGVGHILRSNEVLWYQRTFEIPSDWKGQNVLLHFEASDWETSVYINGKRIGQHRGGYDPFSFDISSVIQKGENSIQVCVWDATEGQSQAIGKQIMPENRQGFRYQPTGGIWRTVWLEPVPQNAIQKIKIIPDFDNSQVKINVSSKSNGTKVKARVFDGNNLIAESTGNTGNEISIPIKNFKFWSPDEPFLYDLKISLENEGNLIDEVTSYFGMRKLEIKTAADGNKRIHLNNKTLFQYGPLDQGYWPDGVLTPPTEDAIKYDLQYLKKIGCNMVRVHIKTHPDRWYYQADKLGLLVWQDMICMPKYGQTVDEAAANQWHTEFKAMVDWLHNHPSIAMWVVFNEGWSQHKTEYYTNWIKEYDPTRIINGASGWTDYPVGDVMDVHDYSFYPRNNAADFKLNGERALVIGEAAGINLAIPGHTWYSEENQPDTFQKRHFNFVPVDNYDFTEEAGRHTYGSPKVFEEAYRKFIETTRLLNAGSGADALVYTQITDVEHELNGYLTYDRKISKIPVDVMREINATLYETPVLNTIVSFGSVWKNEDGLNVSLPFGDKNEFIEVKSLLKSPLVIHKDFNLDEVPSKIAVAVKGFSDCEIKINGTTFRKTKINANRGEPGINIYALFGNEISLLTKGDNTISIVSKKIGETDLLDVAVFNY